MAMKQIQFRPCNKGFSVEEVKPLKQPKASSAPLLTPEEEFQLMIRGNSDQYLAEAGYKPKITWGRIKEHFQIGFLLLRRTLKKKFFK